VIQIATGQTSPTQKFPHGRKAGNTEQQQIKRRVKGLGNWATVGPPMNEGVKDKNLNFTPKTSRQTQRRGTSSRRI
jgi:hypothetical protein